jgi:hypothetical protein
VGRDGFALFLFLPDGEAKYFCKGGWTQWNQIDPVQ